MMYKEQQETEILTIKARTVTLNLSDADVLRISEKAGRAGTTVGALLSSFIGDLVDGTYSNGSDERALAQDWFDRCGFSYEADKTFLRYLLDYGNVDALISSDQAITQNKDDLWELETKPQKSAEDLEEIQSLKGDISYWQGEIDSTFSDFITWCQDDPHESFEEEMKKVRAWANSYAAFLNGTDKERM